MKDRLIFRVSPTDEANLGAVMEALRHRATNYQDRYPTRTKAVREALRVAATHLGSSAGSSTAAQSV